MRASASLRGFLRRESGTAALALAGVLAAVIWANSPWSAGYHDMLSTQVALRVGDTTLGMSVHGWVNDGLMTLFFFVVGLEVRRELALGELTDRRRIVVPLVAGVLGAAVPALLYLAVNGRSPEAVGWGAVIGTDTAFVLGALAIVGPRLSTQLRLFLLTMSVIDDIIAVSVIGIAYSGHVDLPALGLAVVFLAALGGLARAGVWQGAPYLVVLGALWAATVASGLHTSIAGMLAGLLVSAAAPRRDAVEGAARLVRAFRQSPMASVGRSAQRGIVRAVPVNERLQGLLQPWTSYLVVPVFALANAGVELRGGALADAAHSPVTWGVVLALVVGKLVGITTGTTLAVRLGLGRLPRGVGPGSVVGAAALSGIGFTISLLVVGLAFDDPRVRDDAAIGVLAAGVLATGLGALVFRLAAVLLGERSADLPRELAAEVEPDARPHPRAGRRARDARGVPGLRVPVLRQGDRRGQGAPGALRRRPAPRRAAPAPSGRAPARRARGRRRRGRGPAGQVLGDARPAVHAARTGWDASTWWATPGSSGWTSTRSWSTWTTPTVADRVREDVLSAEAGGARGTPTFFVGRVRHEGPHDAASLIAALERQGVASGSSSA